MKYLFFPLLALLFACGGSQELATVEELDLEKYQGKWYEIARIPNQFEENLMCVTAEYSIKDNGKVKVINRGKNNETMEWEEAEGEAKLPNPETEPGVLKVAFFKPFYGDYYVMEVDELYQYALVGSPDRDYLWILGRTPVLPKNVTAKLMAKAEAAGFDLSDLIWTEHSCSE